MIQDEKLERLKTAYKYLYVNGLIQSVSDLAKKMGRARPGVNNALNGKEGFFNDSFLSKFVSVFPVISYTWIMTGEGSMTTKKEPAQETPAPATSNTDAIIDLYAHLIADVENLRAQTITALQEAKEIKSELEEARHQYLDATAMLKRLLDRLENQETPTIGIAADDRKLGCS